MRFWVAGLVVVAGLAACSSGDGSAASSSTPAFASSESAIGGTAVCDTATITRAIADEIRPTNMQVFDVAQVECAQGWAYASANVGANQQNSVQTNYLFEAEGQFWIPKSLQSICGATRSEVPANLYTLACVSG